MNKLTNASFSQLVVQYERLVYTVCFQLVRDAAAAEDLTQETFLSAYLHRDAIPPGYERQWLCRVATNKAKDYLQSAYQRHTLLPGEDNIPPGLSPPAEETVLRRSAAAEIRDLILHMRQPYQPVCRLCLPEKPPIVLDDALANFDDSRCAAALQFLKEAAGNRQILLFTCHSREGEFFAGDREVFVQRLTDAAVEV